MVEAIENIHSELQTEKNKSKIFENEIKNLKAEKELVQIRYEELKLKTLDEKRENMDKK